jgi:hypothetical protein
LFIGSMIVVLLVACCDVSNLTNLLNISGLSNLTSSLGLTPIDCGMTTGINSTCMKEALQTCRPAEARMAGAPIKVAIISANSTDRCNVKMTGISATVWEKELQINFPENYSAIQQEFSNQAVMLIMSGFENKTADCVIPKTNLDLLNSPGQEITQICHGNLIDFVNSLTSMGGSSTTG